MRDKILALINRSPLQTFTVQELAHHLGLKRAHEIRALKVLLVQMGEAGEIRPLKRNRVGAAQIPTVVRGRLDVSSQGFGFVRSEEDELEVFIPPRYIGEALPGDRVEVALFAPSRRQREEGKRREGEVVRVLERGRSLIVGTVERVRKAYFVLPDDRRIGVSVLLSPSARGEAREGDKVVVEIESWGRGIPQPQGRVVEVLGTAGEWSAELKSVQRDFQLPSEFPPDVLEEAERVPVTIPDDEIRRRLDLRPLLCCTIDPEDAKDFDDAVSLELLPGGLYRLGVHIADVSHYVTEGSPLDREALNRGTSVYFPGVVIPMLPEQISNVVCSLRPESDRLTYSVLMDVTPRGHVERHEIRTSVIHSRRRFTYEEVEDILAQQERGAAAPQPGTIDHMLMQMQRLSATLTAKRMREGSLDFETAEPQFRFDEEGRPVGVVKKVRLRSHRLVEEFMLLANRVVATHIGFARREEHPKPFLFRVHDSPDPEKIRELAVFVRQFGHSLNIEGGVSSKALQRLLDQVKGTEVENVINEVALRAMAKAIYSERNIGHFGLGFTHYAHFTSPIRRYPDLVIHRLLKEYDREVSPERRAELVRRLPFIAKQSSERERTAMEAERAAQKVMHVELMKRRIGDEFDGIISGVTRYGMFIELTETLAEGMIHVRDMDDDYYVYDERTYALIGRNRGKRFRLGDRLTVKVIRVNPEERQIDLALVKPR